VTTGVPLHRWSAVRLARALATRELGASALAAALIERIEALDPGLQAWVGFDAAAARARARALDDGPLRGALHGLPLGVKDIVDTAGIPTACGSPIYAGHVPAVDAACVALARSAGAWVLGKTVCTEFANMVPAATRHPHDTEHTPGGSSSGSAAAVAAGMVPLALGTQTAGSVIRPAAFCGIVGYKPSPGRVARAGTKLNSDTLDEVGVFARSVADAALLAGALCGRVESAQDVLPRIGIALTSQAAQLSSDMLRAVAAAAQRLSAAGARVQDAPWPRSFDALFEAQRIVQLFETARALAPEHAYRRSMLSPALAAFLDEGQRVDAVDYAAAMACGRSARAVLELLFADADVLLAPAAPGAAPRSLSTTGDPLFSRPWQLLGCPCVALRAGEDGAGMPLGVQVVGRPQDDTRTLAAAAWIERCLAVGA
jgi:Asp-tRNA(Asn)/Glu-tRNA(Gln) amidotransferase A subunit family amidase